jgi:hypothetical protein
MTSSAGYIYEGEFSENTLNGVGKITNIQNVEYLGYYKEMELQGGFGRINYPDGSFYEGGIKSFEKSGVGVQNFVDGSSMKGMWINGGFVGAAIPVSIAMALCVISYFVV